MRLWISEVQKTQELDHGENDDELPGRRNWSRRRDEALAIDGVAVSEPWRDFRVAGQFGLR
jgi:hypothetical protein